MDITGFVFIGQMILAGLVHVVLYRYSDKYHKFADRMMDED